MAVLYALLLTVGVAAATDASQAGVRTDYEKMRRLSESVLGKRDATEKEIHDLLIVTFQDADAGVRLQAVGIVSTILSLSAMQEVPAEQQWIVRLRPVAEALRPQLERALDDVDSRVRREALRGVVGSALSTNLDAPLSAAMLRMLAAHFEKHAHTADREFIVSAIQTSYRSSDLEARGISLALLTKALQDQDPYVVQAAGLSATKAVSPEVLPRLVAQLKNPSHIARMGVAQGIASYGAAARGYLPQLEAALAAESDDITRKTIAGTITVITR